MSKYRENSFEELRNAELLDEIYSYLYKNYRVICLEQNKEPNDMPEFIDSLWEDIKNNK